MRPSRSTVLVCMIAFGLGWSCEPVLAAVTPASTGPNTAIALQGAEVLPTPRQLAWQARDLQALVHFGMNTFTGREWGTGNESPALFYPTNLDCAQWVRAAHTFGAGSITLVCKHHDGFCLWPSQYTEHSVKNSPWRGGKGDVVRELSDACRKADLKLGIYLSPGDLHHPDYGINSRKYNDYFCNQLTELLTHYGEICEVFFDGAHPGSRHQSYDFPRFYRLVRQYQPNAVISMRGPDVRWVGNESGTARESEWSVIPLPVPPEKYDWPDLTSLDLGSRERLKSAQCLHWYPAVADVSLRHGWFWRPGSGQRSKTAAELLRIYEQSVGRNAVLQLNLCPDTNGLIPESDLKILEEFGRTIRNLFTTNLLASTNAIVGPFTAEPDGTFTQRVTFCTPQVLKYAVLQEDITKGQRVEQFELAIAPQGGGERTVTATTIGWKRILRLNDLTARELTLRIKQTRAQPFLTLSAF